MMTYPSTYPEHKGWISDKQVDKEKYLQRIMYHHLTKSPAWSMPKRSSVAWHYQKVLDKI